MASLGVAVAYPQTDFTPSIMERTRWHFYVICLFVLSQVFTIPVLPIGKWAVWLGLTDFAIALWVPVLLVWGYPGEVPSKAHRAVFRLLVAFFFLSTLSFLFFRLVLALTPGGGLTSDSGFVFGIFQLYRLVQFFFSFWMVMHIPFDERRLKTLAWLAIGVLTVVCTGVAITYFKILPTETFVSHLPSDGEISGPWNIYHTYTRYNRGGPFGMVGYNHAYVAAQILLLLSFIMHLRARCLTLLDTGLLLLAIGTIFISGSRAGLAGSLLYIGIFFLHQPRHSFIVVIGSLFLMMLIFMGVVENPVSRLVSEETLERSQTLLAATDASNLSSRDVIWQQRLALLNQNLSHWLIGVGFGNAVNSGNNAHMLYLHIILETGIAGLVVTIVMMLKLLHFFWQYDVGFRPIFWGTTAFLFASITQETFYPVPAMGYFLGFYLCITAIVLRQPPHGNIATDGH